MSDEQNWLDNFQDEYASTTQGEVAAANRRETAPKGKYTLLVKKITPQVADDRSKFAGRRLLNLFVVLEELPTVTAFVSISPEPYFSVLDESTNTWMRVKKDNALYHSMAKHDKEFKLWASLESVINPGKNMTFQEIVEALATTRLGCYMTESFRDSEGNYGTPSDAEERAALLGEGLASYNNVSNFHVARG